jgi:hypothetical protein
LVDNDTIKIQNFRNPISLRYNQQKSIVEMNNKNVSKEEIRAIAPLLADMEHLDVSTPEAGYFEQMQDNVLLRLGIECTSVIIPEEQYFSRMQDQVSKLTSKDGQLVIWRNKVIKTLLSTAAVMLIIASVFWLWDIKQSDPLVSSLTNLEEDELFALIDDLHEDELFDLLSQDEIYDLKYKYWSDFVDEGKDLDILPQIFFYD